MCRKHGVVVDRSGSRSWRRWRVAVGDCAYEYALANGFVDLISQGGGIRVFHVFFSDGAF